VYVMLGDEVRVEQKLSSNWMSVLMLTESLGWTEFHLHDSEQSA